MAADAPKKIRARDCTHMFVAIVLMLVGGALLGYGLYLEISGKEVAAGKKGPIEDLDYPFGFVMSVITDFGKFGIGIGALLLGSGISALVVLKRGKTGKGFAIIYFILVLVMLGMLLFVAAVSFLLVANRRAGLVKSFYTDAWENTIENGETSRICKIEERRNCRGLLDNDCRDCVLGSEPGCSGVKQRCAKCSVERDAGVGCYDNILNSARAVYLPIGIVTSTTALVLVVDLILVCSL